MSVQHRLSHRGQCDALLVRQADTQLIGLCADFAHEFFSRVAILRLKNLQITHLHSPDAVRFRKCA